jgi:hypothetical protein
MSTSQVLPLEAIAQRIKVLREKKVLIDSDLASLYGVETRRLNEQVRRNRDRFPEDFIFELTNEEAANLMSQNATSSWGGRRKLPMAFTEHGAIMAATVLNSPQAVNVSVYVVRAFVQLRELVSTHQGLAKRLDALEEKTEALTMKHDAFSRNTRIQLRQLFDALRELTSAPVAPSKQPMGFVSLQEKPGKPKAKVTKAMTRLKGP